MEKISINNYIFNKPLTSDNSGFSKWGIGTRGGKQYFVKEFLSPVYPADDTIFTEKKKQDRLRLCETFVKDKCDLYMAIKEASDGHLVDIKQFFRVGAKYYISTEAIGGPMISVSNISKCNFEDRLRICCSVAHAIAGLHSKKIVHADIKPDNILVTGKKLPQPKIIDFDCSFFEDKCPKLGEELNGDMVYLSPEGFLHIADIESNLSCKMDVFALGLLFHQYLTGELPGFDTNEYQYAYESVLDGKSLDVSKIEHEGCRKVIEKMLKKRPKDRPDMRKVFEILHSILLSILLRLQPQVIKEKEPDLARDNTPEFSDDSTHQNKEESKLTDNENENKKKADSFFYYAGDL